MYRTYTRLSIHILSKIFSKVGQLLIFYYDNDDDNKEESQFVRQSDITVNSCYIKHRRTLKLCSLKPDFMKL